MQTNTTYSKLSLLAPLGATKQQPQQSILGMDGIYRFLFVVLSAIYSFCLCCATRIKRALSTCLVKIWHKSFNKCVFFIVVRHSKQEIQLIQDTVRCLFQKCQIFCHCPRRCDECNIHEVPGHLESLELSTWAQRPLGCLIALPLMVWDMTGLKDREAG